MVVDPPEIYGQIISGVTVDVIDNAENVWSRIVAENVGDEAVYQIPVTNSNKPIEIHQRHLVIPFVVRSALQNCAIFVPYYGVVVDCVPPEELFHASLI